jgi:hypothetical protein
MYDHVGAVFNRPQQDGRRDCVVDNQWDAVFVRDTCESFDVRDVSGWVAYAFAKDRSRVFVD